MTERDDNFKPGDDRLSFTQEEISRLVKFTEIGFRTTKSNILSDKDAVLSRLKDATNSGLSLSYATIAQVGLLFQSIEGKADIIRSQGDYNEASASEIALEGIRFLGNQIVLGEACSLGHDKEMLADLRAESIYQDQSLLNKQIPLSEQAEQFLFMDRRADKLDTLYRDDPSGFTIINNTVEELENPSSDLYNSKLLDLTYAAFVLCGIREAADFYKEVYLLGYSANLGPKPKT